MKTLRKVSALFLLSLTLCLPGFSQEKPKPIQLKETEAKQPVVLDHLLMVDGKMMVMKDKKVEAMTKEVTLSDGTRVMADGTMVAKDGTKSMLKEGDALGMDGKPVIRTSERNSAKSDAQKLQGTWQLIYQRMDGEELPDEKAAEMFHGKMIIGSDKIRYSVQLPGFDFEFAYKLHPEEQPKAIDLQLTHTGDKQGIGQEMLGIYLLEGDTLKICHRKTSRPTDFNADKGSLNVLIVLKRKVETQ